MLLSREYTAISMRFTFISRGLYNKTEKKILVNFVSMKPILLESTVFPRD